MRLTFDQKEFHELLKRAADRNKAPNRQKVITKCVSEKLIKYNLKQNCTTKIVRY